jgi:hypothetical protein
MRDKVHQMITYKLYMWVYPFFHKLIPFWLANLEIYHGDKTKIQTKNTMSVVLIYMYMNDSINKFEFWSKISILPDCILYIQLLSTLITSIVCVTNCKRANEDSLEMELPNLLEIESNYCWENLHQDQIYLE